MEIRARLSDEPTFRAAVMSAAPFAAIIAGAVCVLATPCVAAEPLPPPSPDSHILTAFGGALRDLSRRVAPSVVEVRATGYGPIEDTDVRRAGLILGAQQSVGSGVIVDPDGYILTNAHVLMGAENIDVVLRSVGRQGSTEGRSATEESLHASVAGVAAELDLALLKVDATGLRAIKIVDSTSLRQGDIVFAFGNPEGLGNSMTMGVVSAVARQLDQDSPNLYIQTDAPINPGNSGGPLVNADGDLIGINTLIVSASGGSQGLGFAIPSGVVMALYPLLRQRGSARRGTVGIEVQAVTGPLAVGLGLSRTSGVIISDVAPDGAAHTAGVQVQDIVLAADGISTPSVPVLALHIFAKMPGDTLTLTLLRGSTTISVPVLVAERSSRDVTADHLTNSRHEMVARLGIMAANIEPTTVAVLSQQRIQSGVLVVARDQRSLASEVPLTAGDIIHAVNGITVPSIDTVRVLIDGLKRNDQVVLQIERDGRLRFITQSIF